MNIRLTKRRLELAVTRAIQSLATSEMLPDSIMGLSHHLCSMLDTDERKLMEELEHEDVAAFYKWLCETVVATGFYQWEHGAVRTPQQVTRHMMPMKTSRSSLSLMR